MPHVILTAQVEDSKKWVQAFQTHGDVFRALGTTVIHYTASDRNEVALHGEVVDLDQYFRGLQSPETLAAMAVDGVKPDTVKVFALDREWHA